MKILFDYQCFYRDKVGGVSRYFNEIINHFPSDYESKIEILTSNNVYIEDLKVSYKVPDWNNRLYHKAIKTLNQIDSIKAIRKNDYDIFHPTSYDPYYISHAKKPVVVTIHDMIWEVYHLNPIIEKWRRKQILSADKIITVSEYTRKDLLEMFDIDPSNVETIYHGVNALKYDIVDVPYGRYVLFVGKRDGYKNFENFIRAMSIIIQKDKDLNVICTGNKFTNKELVLIHDLGLEHNVFQKFVSDVELYNLYSNALLFVYPSLYEGFGIPILEAFYCKCPTAISNASCFPEIAQDASFYFDSLSIESMIFSLSQVLYNDDLRNDLVMRGEKRLSAFSWRKAANETCSVYQSLI